MRVWLACALLSAGCSYTFDDRASDVRLVGFAPPAASLQSIHVAAEESFQFLDGADGATWMAIFGAARNRVDGPVHAVRLADPATVETFDGSYTILGSSAVYLVEFGEGDADSTMVVRRPGEAGQGRTLVLSGNHGRLVMSPHDRAVFWRRTPDFNVAMSELLRTDSGFRRPIATDEADDVNGSPRFDADDEYVFTFEHNGHVVRHATRSDEDLTLGLWCARPPIPLDLSAIATAVDDVGRQLVFCGPAGVYTVPFDGSPGRTLDPIACELGPAGDVILGFQVVDGLVLYNTQHEVRSVRVDGSEPPRTIYAHAKADLIALTPSRAATTHGGFDQWSHHVSDGFVDGWQFMERGREAQFSRDGKRIRFIEDAADDDGVGELRAASLGGASETLARNVWQFDEIGDGRVLAAANRWQIGDWNRVIVIDEQSRTAAWVAEGVKRYTLIPGTNDVLAEGVVDGEYLRCPIPVGVK